MRTMLAVAFGLVGLQILGEAATTSDWTRAVSEIGLAATLVLFFTWQSFKREQRMAEAIRRMEDFQQGELLRSQERMVKVIEDNTTAMDRVCKVVERCDLANGRAVPA